MKINIPTPSRRSDGSATLIFTILLSIMVILVAAEMRSLTQLHDEEKFLEQQQIKRLTQSQSATNVVTMAALPVSK